MSHKHAVRLISQEGLTVVVFIQWLVELTDICTVTCVTLFTTDSAILGEWEWPTNYNCLPPLPQSA